MSDPNAGFYATQGVAPPQQVNGQQQGQFAGPPQNYQPVRLEDTDIYQRAINVSSPRMAPDENDDIPEATFRKKVVRRVEVPFTRKVKVPTSTTQIVPTMVEQKIKVKKLVTVPGFETVDEEYTVYEDREMVRNKEIWVKKIVPEKYIEKVPVKKTRKVQKPTQVVKEVEEWQTVQVPSTTAVQVQGYRVDEVEDSKIVEVEEFQNYRMLPQPDGPPELAQTRDLGRIPHSHRGRQAGGQVFGPNDPQIRDIDEDSTPDNFGVSRPAGSGAFRAIAPSQGGYSNWNAPNSSANRSYYRQSASNGQGYAETRGAYDQSGYGDTKKIRSAGGFRQLSTNDSRGLKDPNPALTVGGPLGMSVKNTHTRHTDGTGVLVTKVDRGSAAARAGFQANDIITSVCNRPTQTVEEFANAVKQIQGPLLITLNRDGRRNIGLTLNR